MTLIRRGALFAILAFFTACMFPKSDEGKTEDVYGANVKAIKFIGTVNDYPLEIYGKLFWEYPEEHAYLDIYYYGTDFFLEEIGKKELNNGETFSTLKYAFILEKEGVKDTIYADLDLKSWKIKRGGVFLNYYDKEGEISEKLRNMYSFFRECW